MTEMTERPALATIFGWTNIAFGILGATGLLLIISAFSFMASMFNLLAIVHGLISVLLLVAGIFLLRKKSRALNLNVIYAIASLTVTSARLLLVIIRLEGDLWGLPRVMGAGGMFGIAFSLVYPLLILLVLLKDADVKKYYSS